MMCSTKKCIFDRTHIIPQGIWVPQGLNVIFFKNISNQLRLSLTKLFRKHWIRICESVIMLDKMVVLSGLNEQKESRSVSQKVFDEKNEDVDDCMLYQQELEGN